MFRCTRIIPYYEKKVKEVETLLLLTSYIERICQKTQYEIFNNSTFKAQDLGQTTDEHLNQFYVAQNHIFVLQ
jgi:hypothetical protein